MILAIIGLATLKLGKMADFYSGKKVAVFGLGVSGLGVAEFLSNQNWKFPCGITIQTKQRGFFLRFEYCRFK